MDEFDSYFDYPHDDTADKLDYSCLRCGATVREGVPAQDHIQWHRALDAQIGQLEENLYAVIRGE